MAARGGRGGGFRGGRGGRGGRAAPPGLPWDYDPNLPIPEPLETYPKSYKPPTASQFPLTSSQQRSVKYFIGLRRDFHDSPRYTHPHLRPDSVSSSSQIGEPVRKAYGRAQQNDRFRFKSKADVDPFTATPTYSHKFVSEIRTVPDFTDVRYSRSLFPQEILDEMEGNGKVSEAAAAKKRKRDAENELERKRRIEEAAEGGGEEGAGEGEEELDDEEGLLEPEDDDYEDDEDGGDYNAEAYFDGGDDMEGDDGEGGGEYGMDF